MLGPDLTQPLAARRSRDEAREAGRSVSLEANPHRSTYFKSVHEWLKHGVENHRPGEVGPTPEEMAAIEAGATLWALQWYPHTPNGFHRLFGSNLERMVDEALKDMGG